MTDIGSSGEPSVLTPDPYSYEGLKGNIQQEGMDPSPGNSRRDSGLQRKAECFLYGLLPLPGGLSRPLSWSLPGLFPDCRFDPGDCFGSSGAESSFTLLENPALT